MLTEATALAMLQVPVPARGRGSQQSLWHLERSAHVTASQQNPHFLWHVHPNGFERLISLWARMLSCDSSRCLPLRLLVLLSKAPSFRRLGCSTFVSRLGVSCSPCTESLGLLFLKSWSAHVQLTSVPGEGGRQPWCPRAAHPPLQGPRAPPVLAAAMLDLSGHMPGRHALRRHDAADRCPGVRQGICGSAHVVATATSLGACQCFSA